jgi:pimeloyl-ACP methyl ester carboxylesterase
MNYRRSKYVPHQKIRRLLFYGAGSCIIALIVLAISFFYYPIEFRRWVLQPMREISYLNRELKPIHNWDKISFDSITPSQTQNISTTRGLKIAFDIYTPNEFNQGPVAIILHGSSPWGRKAGFVLKLSKRLAQDGFLVIAPDARGFGDSEDPQNLNDAQSWSTQNDAELFLDYVDHRMKVHTDGIVVIGHSLGAAHALEGWAGHPRIDIVVLIGPPRYINGMVTNRWKRIRFSADRGLPSIVSKQTMLARMQASDILFYAENMVQVLQHQPTLLIDGELEKEEEHSFLRTIAQKINPAVTYVTLAETGHYCGAYNLFGFSTVIVRNDLFENFYNIVNTFIVQNSPIQLLSEHE